MRRRPCKTVCGGLGHGPRTASRLWQMRSKAAVSTVTRMVVEWVSQPPFFVSFLVILETSETILVSLETKNATFRAAILVMTGAKRLAHYLLII
ncbi:hypothetical protein SAMN05192534_10330 [Alteribacillus persepolensis]|uniref:Uncharacterized protein n=1 Tax=Alteribacillus persepolensis TaxID=568899 RepID=A0A1G8AWP0_9BACI|nr:hypothetical protein [Alteribacillus persepolensis]SDH24780.1 hypothetical protein SAMN05192534_10330 [Alteribacillus persepolensis]